MLNQPSPADFVVRPMTLSDLKDVCQIDRDAFDAYRRARRQINRPLRLRTPENMNAALRRPHPGVVVESPPGRIAGYCFTHIWGSLGWLGTLGVAPRKQGFGLGRAVIAAGLDVLREAGCTTLALETMPESGKNLALYTSLGLEARYMTFLYQGAITPADRTHASRWNGGDEIAAISGQIVPGLDCTPAARWLEAEEAGMTLIWREDGLPVAFAILRHGPRRLQNAQTYLTVEAAACLPGAAGQWPQYLAEVQTYAHNRRIDGLVLPVNALQYPLLRSILAAGLQIVHTRVRMVSGPPLGDPDALLMLTLAI